jgi:hypothetical protein
MMSEATQLHQNRYKQNSEAPSHVSLRRWQIPVFYSPKTTWNIGGYTHVDGSGINMAAAPL